MKDINEIKNRIKNKQTKEVKKSFKGFFIKLFLVVMIFISLTFLVNNNPKIKSIIFSKVYNSNISFAKIKKIYNEKIGNILPFGNFLTTKKVFSEKLTYKSISKYNRGAKLVLEDNYLIPAIKGGIVIFSGEKDGLKTVTIQQPDGIDASYKNLKNVNIKLYDYVDDNEILGEAKDNILYLTFQKDGVEIDYKEVIK